MNKPKAVIVIIQYKFRFIPQGILSKNFADCFRGEVLFFMPCQRFVCAESPLKKLAQVAGKEREVRKLGEKRDYRVDKGFDAIPHDPPDLSGWKLKKQYNRLTAASKVSLRQVTFSKLPDSKGNSPFTGIINRERLSSIIFQ